MPGDDFRRIDWKVYGRTEKLFVREYEEERALTTHVLLDTSASMDFNGKYERAGLLALGFAYLSDQEGERFAVNPFANDLRPRVAKRGGHHLREVFAEVEAINPGGESRIGHCMEHQAKALRNKALVVVVSDFLDDPTQIEAGVQRLAPNDLVLIQVLSEFERDLPPRGPYDLVDVETGETLGARLDKGLREDYQRRLRRHCKQVEECARSNDAEYHLHYTDEEPLSLMRTILEEGHANH